MGLQDNLFKPQKEKSGIKWKVFDKESQIQAIIRDSYHQAVVVFKHSIYCGTSDVEKRRLEKGWNSDEKDIDFYLLDIIDHRVLSNKVEEVFGVIHQSPQIIVVKDGRVVSHLSHHAISVEELCRSI